jgi:hypothetical protein
MSFIFNLNKDCSIEELNREYLSKIDSISSSNLPENEKPYYIRYLIDNYNKLAKEINTQDLMVQNNQIFTRIQDTIDRMHRNFDTLFHTIPSPNKLSNSVYSYQRNYRKENLPDGSILCFEHQKLDNNGNVNEISSSYKTFNDGRIEPVNIEESLSEMSKKNLR